MNRQLQLSPVICRRVLLSVLALLALFHVASLSAQTFDPPTEQTGGPELAPPIYEPVDPFMQPAAESISPVEAVCGEPYCWQALPAGLIWHSYMAGYKEPGMRAIVGQTRSGQQIWDFTLGGRVGLVRYGTTSGDRPEGWQFDLEGAATPRLDAANSYGLLSCDYRFGFPLSYGTANGFRAKLAYYHLSSHLGDQFMQWNPGVFPIHYTRDNVVLGLSQYFYDCFRIYGEIGLAFHTMHGAEPLEFQLGAEYSPVVCNPAWGSPFAAVNVYLRQEIGFRGDIVVQAGWQWRQGTALRRWRIGVQFYDGYGEPREFFSQRETKLGAGVWYDF